MPRLTAWLLIRSVSERCLPCLTNFVTAITGGPKIQVLLPSPDLLTLDDKLPTHSVFVSLKY